MALSSPVVTLSNPKITSNTQLVDGNSVTAATSVDEENDVTISLLKIYNDGSYVFIGLDAVADIDPVETVTKGAAIYINREHQTTYDGVQRNENGYVPLTTAKIIMAFEYIENENRTLTELITEVPAEGYDNVYGNFTAYTECIEVPVNSTSAGFSLNKTSNAAIRVINANEIEMGCVKFKSVIISLVAVRFMDEYSGTYPNPATSTHFMDINSLTPLEDTERTKTGVGEKYTRIFLRYRCRRKQKHYLRHAG